MTRKTTKTILFASLIAALILPFSVMSMADAATNENADRTQMKEMGYELTGSLAIPNENRDSMLAQGYELYPGGWIHEDRIKADLIYVKTSTGEKILDGDAMKLQYEQRLAEAGIAIQSHPKSYHIAVKDSPSNDISYSRAYWNVPDSPGTYDGGTNYDFNAIQPTLSTNVILQPILQHGYSSWCDAGDNWVTYPFMLVYGNPIGGNCISANEDDFIRGVISESSYNTWTVYMKNYDNSAATDSVSLMLSNDMTAVFTAVETWNIPSNCNELQGDVQYRYLYDRGDVDSWDAKVQGSTFCGMNTNIVSDSTVQFNNNN